MEVHLASTDFCVNMLVEDLCHAQPSDKKFKRNCNVFANSNLRARGMENESSVFFFRKLCKACFCDLVSRHC